MPLMNADALNEVNNFLHVFQGLLLGEKITMTVLYEALIIVISMHGSKYVLKG